MSHHLEESLQQRLQDLRDAGLQRDARIVESIPGSRCRIDGRELISFGSNDYLSLAHDPRVCRAFADAARKQSGATASSLIIGRSRWHAELERQLAAFEDDEAALLFPTGFAANLGVIQALVRPQDHIFSERENHASLIDAVRGTKAPVSIYSRNHPDQLASMIEQQRSSFDQGFIVTDGVFSMDGTIAPLKELCELADQYGLAVIVDEAHGTGVLGESGRGASELAGVLHQPFARIGTLSKAMGCLGGFVTGSQQTIEWLRNRARPQFFSTALPPAVCAAALESLRIIREEPQRREVLQRLNRLAREQAQQLGLSVPGGGPAPIVPVVMPDSVDVTEFSELLQQEGWFVPGIRPPTVPPGTSRFRLSLTVDHQPEQIRDVLNRIAELSRLCAPSDGSVPDGSSAARMADV